MHGTSRLLGVQPCDTSGATAPVFWEQSDPSLCLCNRVKQSGAMVDFQWMLR